MSPLVPEGVFVDSSTGRLSSSTGRYIKKISELRSIHSDSWALEELIADHDDPIVYEVVEYKKLGSDICFGTTALNPGRVGDEYFMTRGHFHARQDMGEIYLTQRGTGLLLLEARDGRFQVVEMAPGVCAFIPPEWAHRTVNVGADKLVFMWACNAAAGQDYADIPTLGMRKRVVERNGHPAIIENSAYRSRQ